MPDGQCTQLPYFLTGTLGSVQEQTPEQLPLTLLAHILVQHH